MKAFPDNRDTVTTATSLRQRAISASFWTAGGFGAQRLVQFISNLVLTRLLFPEAFGIMALANVILVGLAMFSDVGIKPAIIQNDRGEDPAFLNTAWSIQILRGFALWIAAIVLAYPASVIYGQPILFPLISVLGATAAINGMASTSLAISERRLSISRLTGIQIIGQVVTLTLTAMMAWQIRSVWALAYGALVGASVTTWLSYVIIPSHVHRFFLEREAFNTLFRFGRWIFLSTLVTFLGGQGLRAIQGVYLSAGELGILALAQTLAWMPGDLVAQLMNMVGFPALSELSKRGHTEMANALHGMRIKVLLMALPMFIGISLISGPLIKILYDFRYAEAGGYLAILSITGSISIIPMGYQSAFMAIGNTRLHFVVLTVSMATRILGLIGGFYVGGINGMLIGIGCGSIISYFFTAVRARRLGLFKLPIDAAGFAAVGVAALVCWEIYG